MPIHVACPQCAKLLAIGTQQTGVPIRCPACGESFEVPEKSQIAHRPPVIARKMVLGLLIIGSVIVATLFLLHFRKQPAAFES